MSPQERILIVDDDETIRSVLSRFLSRRGFDVVAAQDGAAGIERLRDSQPDLVLCDLRMPGIDGLNVLANATRLCPDTPVIVMSGVGLFDDAVNALKLGAFDYLTKPFGELIVVEHAVRRALQSGALKRENERYRLHLEKVNRDLSTSLRMLQEDEEAGRQIQFRLLPRNHQHFRGFEFSRDLSTSTHLSGDFVDTFAIDDRHIGFYLADVAGHGVSSAFVTVFLKSFVQRLLEQHRDVGSATILEPSRALARLNSEMLRDGLGKHLTIFYGVIDTRRGELVYSSGGQFPFPILYDGVDSHVLDGRGFPVGLFNFASYGECRLELPEHFVLAVCSDGVLEILEEEDLESKTAHLRALVSDLDITVEDLHEQLAVERRMPLPDDVTLLMVKHGAHDERAV